MHVSDPINIMLDYCIPDKKKLGRAISKLAPGETVQVKIDNCVAARAIVDSFLKNKLCRVVETVEHEDVSILHIRLDISA